MRPSCEQANPSFALDGKRIGIVGTGFIGRGLVRTLARQEGITVSKVLTRRDLHTCGGHPRPDLLTNSVEELLEDADLVVECSGDVVHAADVVDRALAASRPVVTMNAEFHATCGSYFVGKGCLTEAAGDQPGALAELRESAIQMGFQPRVYGNVKGFYNPDPTRDEMHHWSRKLNISVPMATAATDGTKIQFEQALVANGLGAGIAAPGLLGPACDDLHTGATHLAESTEGLGSPISDFVVLPGSRVRVFLVARHDESERATLQYLKMGEGPYYVLTQSTMLTYLEIPRTIRRVLNGSGPLLNNSSHPRVSVSAIAKRPLAPGTRIQSGIGSFEMRGEVVRIADEPNHVPIGLLSRAVITRGLDVGQRAEFDDVELPESLSLRAWMAIRREATT